MSLRYGHELGVGFHFSCHHITCRVMHFGHFCSCVRAPLCDEIFIVTFTTVPLGRGRVSLRFGVWIENSKMQTEHEKHARLHHVFGTVGLPLQTCTDVLCVLLSRSVMHVCRSLCHEKTSAQRYGHNQPDLPQHSPPPVSAVYSCRKWLSFVYTKLRRNGFLPAVLVH